METEDTVRLPGGEPISRRIEYSGETNLRPDQPVEIEWYEILDDEGRPTEVSIKLRTPIGAPGLSMKEQSEVRLDVLHVERTKFEVWKRRAAIRIPDDTDAILQSGSTFIDLQDAKLRQADDAVKSTSRALRTSTTVSPARLDEVLKAFADGGIHKVTALGYSRSHAYKLVSRARQELGK
jgi:hypothetical protein